MADTYHLHVTAMTGAGATGDPLVSLTADRETIAQKLAEVLSLFGKPDPGYEPDWDDPRDATINVLDITLYPYGL